MKIFTMTVKIWESKKYPMSEGNTCIAEPNLEVLSLTKISKRLVSTFF